MNWLKDKWLVGCIQGSELGRHPDTSIVYKLSLIRVENVWILNYVISNLRSKYYSES